MCCFRNAKNFERFNLVIQSIICLMVSQLRSIESFLVKPPPVKVQSPSDPKQSSTDKEEPPEDDTDEPSKPKKERFSSSSSSTTSSSDNNHNPDHSSSSSSNTSSPLGSSEDSFSLSDVEQILIMMSKAFLLHFPLYVAYKHSAHPRLDDLSANDVQALSAYCDLHDNEIPVFLLRNVTLFCNGGGEL